MANQNFLPSSDALRLPWLTHFSGVLPNYAKKYKITEAEQAFVKAGCEWFAAMLSTIDTISTFANTAVAFKNAVRDGLPSGAVLSPLVLPELQLPDGPAVTGIFPFINKLAERIKGTEGYSDVDGRDLGIEGTPIPLPDPATLTPVLAVAVGSGGHPELKWGKQRMAMLEICVDRGTGRGWELLAMSNQARYTDYHELPAAGTTAVWKYRAIYLDHSQHFGQWSAVVLATVVG